MQKQRKLGFLKRKLFPPQKKHSTVETDSYLIYCSSAHGGLSHIERAALVKLSKIHGVERERAGRARMAEMPHVGSCALVGAGRDPVVLYN